MKRTVLAIGAIVLAGFALGQGIAGGLPYFDISRWLGTYQRDDLTQKTLWTYRSGGPAGPNYQGFQVTDLIEVVDFESSDGLFIIGSINGTDFSTSRILWQSGPNHFGPIRVDPEMYGQSPVWVCVRTVTTNFPTQSSRQIGSITYRTR